MQSSRNIDQTTPEIVKVLSILIERKDRVLGIAWISHSLDKEAYSPGREAPKLINPLKILSCLDKTVR